MVQFQIPLTEFPVLFSLTAKVWKLTDFGLSAEATSRRHHTTRYSRGTGGYRAPELLVHDPGKFSNKVDVWALGCVMFELVTLRPAFTEDWEIQQYCLDPDAALVVPFSAISSCPDLIQYHVSGSILDLLHKRSQSRPRASDISRFFTVYCKFLEVAKTESLDDVLRATRNHPSYTEWRTLVSSRVEDEVLYCLADEYEKKEEVAMAAALRRVLIERDALDKYRAALANGVTDSSLLRLRADTYFERGDYDGAIKLYTEAIDEEPNDFWLWHKVSELRFTQNHINAAIHACSDGMKKYPNFLSAKMVLYCLYAWKGDYNSAIILLHGFELDVDGSKPPNPDVDSVTGK